MNLKNILGLIISSSVLIGCGGSSGSSDVADACSELESNTFSCNTMLNDLVDFGVKPVVAELNTDMLALDSNLTAYCAAIADGSKKDSAKAAWEDVVANIQQLQTMQFGPLGNGELAELYSWPSYGASLYDAEIVRQDNDPDIFTLSAGNSRKGLIALEYILFTGDGYTESGDNTVTNWENGKSTTEIQQARCDYALLVSDELVVQTEQLQNNWNNFNLTESASSQQAAANQVTQAFFYADKQIKDAKVKAALPQTSEGVFDSTKLESQFANVSKEHLINNLEGLKRIFTANGEGVGIDDYLVAAGQSDVATTMINQLNTAIENLNDIDGTLIAAVDSGNSFETCSALANNESSATDLSDIDELCKFQYTIKQLTDTLKGDFVLTTSFTIPPSASGDND
ncbi:MAG: imelysin family protein [Bermanella sp.]